ncbi:hypothetical protein ACFLSQ_10120, partial [Bacteroidota bacterium]
MKKIIILFFGLSVISGELLSTDQNYFIQNKGQWNKDALFLYKGNNQNIWITRDGLKIDIFKYEKSKTEPSITKTNDRQIDSKIRKGDVINMEFDNANKNSFEILNKNKCKMYYNYFIDSDSSKWVRKAPCYREIQIKNIYNGIHAKYYFENDDVRYDIIVEPGADPGLIQLNFSEHVDIGISKSGELEIKSEIGMIKQGKIYAYQKIDNSNKEVSCNFVRNKNNSFSFSICNYDKSKPLVIDPLVYLMSHSGRSSDGVNGYIPVDNQGYVYISGGTASNDF